MITLLDVITVSAQKNGKVDVNTTKWMLLTDGLSQGERKFQMQFL